jgi:hypothetical protein
MGIAQATVWWKTPPAAPTYSVAAAGAATSVNEGSSLTFNVSGSNITNGTYYWTVDSNAGDFGTSSGSFTITSNSGSFSVTPTADSTTEGAETFTVSVRTGSTSGTVVATSSSITINDTSTTPFVPVTYTVNSSGTGSYTAPNGATSVKVEAVGSGGSGFGALGFASRHAGGGGAYASVSAIAVSGNSTVIYYNNTLGSNSWVNVGTNSAPGNSAVGCLAICGGNATPGADGTGGAASSCIGTTKYSGATGISVGGIGGGAAGDSSAASGQTGGTGTNITGGNGGSANSAGNAPGGGGGVGTTIGLNPAGAVGFIRITFS